LAWASLLIADWNTLDLMVMLLTKVTYIERGIGEGVHYSDMLLGSDKRYQFEKKKNAK